jgi:hypothetical protein
VKHSVDGLEEELSLQCEEMIENIGSTAPTSSVLTPKDKKPLRSEMADNLGTRWTFMHMTMVRAAEPPVLLSRDRWTRASNAYSFMAMGMIGD